MKEDRIISSKWLRLGTLGLLYFVQGAPYGFQASSLPVMLRQDGVSFTQLGLMKMLFLPWVLKPLYAPLIDGYRTKKFWLIVTMAALGTTCWLTGSFVEKHQTTSLSISLLFLNLFSASQDIAVDSLAVRILSNEEEIGLGNTIQVVAYKGGSIFAGGLLLMVQDTFGWTPMFYVFGLVYALCIVLITQLSLVEKAQHNQINQTDSKIQKSESISQSSQGHFSVLRQVMATPGTTWMIAFLLFYKLCERAEMTFSMFLVDKGVGTKRLATWSSVMKACSMLGSMYGGYRVAQGSEAKTKQGGVREPDGAGWRSTVGVITAHSAYRAVSILCQYLLLLFWDPRGRYNEDSGLDWALLHTGFALQCMVLFQAGTITTATFSLMMSLSQKSCHSSIQGTHYSTLATCEVLGKLLFAAVAGRLLDTWGVLQTFLLFVLFAFATVPFSKTSRHPQIPVKSEEKKSVDGSDGTKFL